jgi:hypothetical protein
MTPSNHPAVIGNPVSNPVANQQMNEVNIEYLTSSPMSGDATAATAAMPAEGPHTLELPSRDAQIDAFNTVDASLPPKKIFLNPPSEHHFSRATENGSFLVTSFGSPGGAGCNCAADDAKLYRLPLISSMRRLFSH